MNRLVAWLGAVALVVSWAGGASAQVKRATVTAAANYSAVEPGQAAAIAVTVDIAKGFHAQSHTPKDEFLVPLTVSVEKDAAVKAGEVVYPPGVDETYAGLGAVNVYTGKVTVFVPVTVLADAKAGALKVAGKVRYQICDDSTCFQPESTPWSVELTVVEKGKAVGANAELFKEFKGATTRATTQPARGSAGTGSGSSGAPPVAVEEGKSTRGVLGWLGIAFVAGILFNVVPCVLPVLPIKVLGFAEVAEHDRGKTVMLASVFGLGVVSVFAVLALLILVLKTITWGQQFSNPYFAWGVVVVLFILSMWLFGLLNLDFLPSATYSFAPRHDTYFGNFLWGVLTALLSTPCTGPLFLPVMGWAAAQPTSVGVPAFMMVGVGMAFPYVVLSAFPEAARKFPRVGPWAELFKQMLGFALLAVTFVFAAGRFTGPAGQWWAAVPVAVMGALYLMARTVQLSKAARAVGIAAGLAVLIVTASVLVAGVFSGLFDARRGAGAAGTEAVKWEPYSEETFEAARKAGKIVLVKFTANWCWNCQYIEGTVYHDATAVDALRKHDVVTIKADLTKDDAAGWGRLRQLSATGGIPLTAIYAPGYEKPVVISSVYTTGTLVKTLGEVAGGGRVVAGR